MDFQPNHDAQNYIKRDLFMLTGNIEQDESIKRIKSNARWQRMDSKQCFRVYCVNDIFGVLTVKHQ